MNILLPGKGSRIFDTITRRVTKRKAERISIPNQFDYPELSLDDILAIYRNSPTALAILYKVAIEQGQKSTDPRDYLYFVYDNDVSAKYLTYQTLVDRSNVWFAIINYKLNSANDPMHGQRLDYLYTNNPTIDKVPELTIDDLVHQAPAGRGTDYILDLATLPNNWEHIEISQKGTKGLRSLEIKGAIPPKSKLNNILITGTWKEIISSTTFYRSEGLDLQIENSESIKGICGASTFRIKHCKHIEECFSNARGITNPIVTLEHCPQTILSSFNHGVDVNNIEDIMRGVTSVINSFNNLLHPPTTLVIGKKVEEIGYSFRQSRASSYGKLSIMINSQSTKYYDKDLADTSSYNEYLPDIITVSSPVVCNINPAQVSGNLIRRAPTNHMEEQAYKTLQRLSLAGKKNLYCPGTTILTAPQLNLAKEQISRQSATQWEQTLLRAKLTSQGHLNIPLPNYTFLQIQLRSIWDGASILYTHKENLYILESDTVIRICVGQQGLLDQIETRINDARQRNSLLYTDLTLLSSGETELGGVYVGIKAEILAVGTGETGESGKLLIRYSPDNGKTIQTKELALEP